MLPIHPRVLGAPEPDHAGMHYQVGANGVFLAVKQPWIQALVPTKTVTLARTTEMVRVEGYDDLLVVATDQDTRASQTVDGLVKLEPYANWLLPPMPAALFAQITKFFHAIMEKQDTECMVMLHYGDQVGWVVTCPEQEVTGGHVDYKMVDRVPNARCVGTMHSHVRMSAFHSGTDVRDEGEFDGLHVTLGMLHKAPNLSVDCEILIRGHRFSMDVTNFIEGETAVQVHKTKPRVRARTSNMFAFYTESATSHRVDPALFKAATFPKDWMDKCKRPTYTNWWQGNHGSYGGGNRGGGGPYGGDYGGYGF